MPDTPGDAILAGQAIYTRRTLRVYDLLVHGLSNRFLWRVSTGDLQAMFDRCVGMRHLDIGVGTGLFLDRLSHRREWPAITLVDLNDAALASAAARLARYRPVTVKANALAPLDLRGPFDSASLCYLLHCLPGDIPQKAVVLDRIRPYLAEGAVVFGATLLQGDAPRSRAAQKLMDAYNARGIFSNAGDRFEDLRAALETRFQEVTLTRSGCAALFRARV